MASTQSAPAAATAPQLQHWLARTAQGDHRAFRQLYDATSSRLLAVAMQLLGERALAEDALQDAYVQVWHRAGDYHGGRGSVMTWMGTLVRYRAIDLLRRRRPDRLTSVDPSDLEPSLSATDAPPMEQVSDEQDVNALTQCIGRLSPEQQRSVSLAFFRGYTHSELAGFLSQPLGTIKSRVRRSLTRLRDCLNELRGGAPESLS